MSKFSGIMAEEFHHREDAHEFPDSTKALLSQQILTSMVNAGARQGAPIYTFSWVMRKDTKLYQFVR